MSEQIPQIQSRPNLIDRQQLWLRAFNELRNSEQTDLGGSLPEHEGANCFAQEIESRKSEIKTQRVHVKIAGRIVELHEVLEGMAKFIRKLQKVGDVIVQFDAGHAALPWAGARLVLVLALSNVEKNAIIVEGLDCVVKYIYLSEREAYLNIERVSSDRNKICERFQAFYHAVLTFLAHAKRHLARNQFARALSSLALGTEKYSSDIQRIKKQYDMLIELAQQASRNDQLDTNQRVQDVQEHLKIQRADREAAHQAQILAWTSGVNHQHRYEFRLSKLYRDCPNWISDTESYRNWRDAADTAVLWLHGPLGTAKSMIITALIADTQQRTADKPGEFVYFYHCSQESEGRAGEEGPTNVLRSLLRQVSYNAEEDSIHESLHELYRDVRYGYLDCDRIANTIIRILNDRPTAFFFIDALNECDEAFRGKLLVSLKRIAQESESRVKLFVTSQVEQDIAALFGAFPSIASRHAAAASGLSDFVGYSAQEAKSNGRMISRLDESEFQNLLKVLRSNADGQFRWVEASIQVLDGQRSMSAYKKSLGQLPKSLGEAYCEIYNQNRINDQDLPDVRLFTLRWLLSSNVTKQLASDDLLNAVIHSDDSCLEIFSELTVPELLEYCRGFVELNPFSNSFQFLHSSIQDFLSQASAFSLADQAAFDTGANNALAASACLRILSRRRNVTEQLHSYASFCWIPHLRRAGGHSSLDAILLDSFLWSDPESFTAWSEYMAEMYAEGLSLPSDWKIHYLGHVYNDVSDPLLLACAWNMEGSISRMLALRQTKQTVLTHSLESIVPVLHLAIAMANANISGMLLGSGIDATVRDSMGRAPLHVLAETDPSVNQSEFYIQMAQQLVSFGAHLDERTGTGASALALAAGRGNKPLVQILLQLGGAVDAKDERMETALFYAIANAHADIVTLLLDHGASPPAPNIDGECPLSASIYSQSPSIDIIDRILRSQGVDVNSPSKFDTTPLHHAAIRGDLDIIKLLLKAGADINAADAVGDSPLLLSIARTDPSVSLFLIEKGANLQHANNFGWTPRKRSTRFGESRVLQAIVEAEGAVAPRTTVKGGQRSNETAGAAVRQSDIVA